MHFTAGGFREENYGDDCREASDITNGRNYREPTTGCPQVDKNKTTGQLGKVFGGQTVLQMTVSAQRVNGLNSTDEETVEDYKTSKQANRLAGGNGEVAILLCTKQESEIAL